MSTVIQTPITSRPPVEPTPPRRSRRVFAMVLETVFALAFAIVLLELLFRICGIGGQEFLQPDRVLGTVHIPNKVVTWRLEGYSNNRLSSVGLRDTEHAVQKAPGTFRIALVGDSATEGLQVDLSETFGKVVENELNAVAQKSLKQGPAAPHYEVINFGCSGYSTGQELIQYRKLVSRYHPDALVLLYNRGDSMENILDHANIKSTDPRPYFYLDAHNTLQQDKSVLELNADKLSPPPALAFLQAHSRIYGAFSQMNLSLLLNESRYRKLKIFLSNVNQQHKPADAAPQSYPKQDSLLVTCALLQQLEAEASHDHCKLYIMTFPNSFKDRALSTQYMIFKPYAKLIGAQFLDLTIPFEKDPAQRDDFLEYHFSARGHKLVAEELFKLLSRHTRPPSEGAPM